MATSLECRLIVDRVLDLAKDEAKNLPDFPFVDEKKIARDKIEEYRELIKKRVCQEFAEDPL